MSVLPALSLTLALALAGLGPVTRGPPLADDVPARLGIALRLADLPAVKQRVADQQDPASPHYRRWLTPTAFGERFGASADRYSRFARWLSAAGFHVTPYPNRLFLEADGTVASVRRLLGIQLHEASADGRAFRTFEGEPTIPAELTADLLHISGLDTRVRLRRRLTVPQGAGTLQVLGAADLRVEYGMTTLTQTGGAAGLTLVVLGTQEGTLLGSTGNVGAPLVLPSSQAINAYLSTLSQATATYTPIVMMNPNADYNGPGSNQESELDVEMQSVGAPRAASIDLLLTPASVLLTDGAQYLVNMIPTAVTVSTSLGLCETDEEMGNGGGPTSPGSEPVVFEQAVLQGLSEGQTWFAASGDTGADDCHDAVSSTNNGYDGGNATVDFPASMPEVVALGGTEFLGAPNWTAAGDLPAFVAEADWSEGARGGAAGGGQSTFYAKPTWQQGIGPGSMDGVRDVPDIALEASANAPGIAAYWCGAKQDVLCQGQTADAGNIDIVGGTSAAAPLAAGIFALLAGELGCHLGDVHPALYQLGVAQQDGGAAVFHDITRGNNSFPNPQGQAIAGFAAGPGYDLASGWGSLDVAALVASWPPCPTGASSSSGTSTGGSTNSSAASSSSSSSSGTAGSSSSSSGGTAAAASSSSSSTSGSIATSTGTSGGSSRRTDRGATTGCTCGSPSDGPDWVLSAMTAALLSLARGSRARRAARARTTAASARSRARCRRPGPHREA